MTSEIGGAQLVAEVLKLQTSFGSFAEMHRDVYIFIEGNDTAVPHCAEQRAVMQGEGETGGQLADQTLHVLSRGVVCPGWKTRLIREMTLLDVVAPPATRDDPRKEHETVTEDVA